MPLSLRLVGIAVFSGWMTANFLIPSAALGQITPDTTLGTESSLVLSGGGDDLILGGATRGANLFHSFSEFNVAEEKLASFINPVGIERIFSRVTGGEASNILGELRVSGNADLFLLNPNGILFGPRSSLSVAGSFVATTADGFVFEDNQFFNARNPAPAPLLAVNVPIGLQYGNQQSGTIRSQGILGVNQGKSLLLAGGNIVLENSSVSVSSGSGGQVQIAAVDDVGILDLTLNDGLISLDIGTDLNRSDMSIMNSQISVSSNERTSIAISANDINISNSIIFAGIGLGLGFSGAEAGNIQINADSLALGNGTVISNSAFGEGSAGNLIIQVDGPVSLDSSGILGSVPPNTVGGGGEIELSAGSLNLTNGAFIDSSTFGNGNAGNLMIQVDGLVSLDSSGLFSAVFLDAIGEGGDIKLTAGALRITNGAGINVSTLGDGNAGNLILNVDGLVAIDGRTPNGQSNSGLFSSVEAGAVGEGGDIELTAGSLRITHGAAINANTRGEGSAGNLVLNIDGSIFLNGTTPNGQFASGLFSTVDAGAAGEGGDIEITAKALRITNGAAINASTFEDGNAGNLILNVDGLVAMDGTTPNGQFSSGLFSAVAAGAVGEGGDIELTAGALRITNGAAISASTFEDGNAGNLILNVDGLVAIDGTTPNGQFSSGLFSTVEAGAVGEGGDIRITAEFLQLINGAAISAISSGQGNPGNIDLRTADNINLEQGFISSSSSSLLSERGGNILIDAGSLNLENGSLISTETFNSQGGNITINLDDLLIMRDSSLISTTAGTAQAGGNGGNIDIAADFVIGVREENSDIAADAFEGNGGQVTISALDIFGLEFREERTSFSDITASSEQGASGITTFNQLTPVDVRQGLTELPENVVDPTGLIDRSCNTSAVQNSEFVITGRGGLPPEPDERSDNSQFFDDLGPIVTPSNSAEAMAEPLPSKNDSPDSIQEAQGWIVNDMGQIQLIAAVPSEASVRTATSPCN